MPKEKIPDLSLNEVAEREGKSLRWINYLVSQNRLKGVYRPTSAGTWAVKRDYKILPPAASEPSKTAQAVAWLDKNPNARASEAAKLFDVDKSSISWYRKRRREGKL